MAYLILVRHGESLWNANGTWTGLTDVSLSEKGRFQSKNAAKLLTDIPINFVYVSTLKRAKETWNEMKQVLKSKNIIVVENKALNERDYGTLTGKNKWEIKKQFGDDKFIKIRRGWNYPIPNGETLKDVYNRVIPYYQKEILPKIIFGKNILIAAHGNSLRALIKYLEKINDRDIEKVEMRTGEIYVYDIDKKGKIISKEIRMSS